jgi:hypothetical protein
MSNEKDQKKTHGRLDQLEQNQINKALYELLKK